MGNRRGCGGRMAEVGRSNHRRRGGSAGAGALGRAATGVRPAGPLLWEVRGAGNGSGWRNRFGVIMVGTNQPGAVIERGLGPKAGRFGG